MRVQTFNEIIQATKHAEEKHPFFTENPQHAVSLATEELGEMAKSVNDGNLEQAKAEALDTIAVLVRFIYMLEDL
ncbi:hypothetical protein [Candidatus Avelusimicrobium fimicolum]|uniref:hypothetical protein n=1 Tax=Candidatus Avelusimicrobium fimicolum TaxID=3416216 RepID=UPI003D09EAE1